MNNEIIRPFPEIVTENTSEKTALIDKKRSMTYRQLGAAVKAYAAFLAGEGVKKGDRV
ncbi:MAG: AMP-binding protein, partial [Ruminococcus sp.]|nr:AMP-binding protein [Ruminococcus sp.]